MRQALKKNDENAGPITTLARRISQNDDLTSNFANREGIETDALNQ